MVKLKWKPKTTDPKANNIWFENVTIKFENENEYEASIEISAGVLLFHSYISTVIRGIDRMNILMPVQVVGSVVILQTTYGLPSRIQIRFGTPQSQEHFLEMVFPDRNQDSANSTGSSSSSSSSN